MPNFISEDQIEVALVNLLRDNYGYQTLNCFTAEAADLNDQSGRTDKTEVILRPRLEAATAKLNPHIPAAIRRSAIEQLCDKRQTLSPVAANEEFTEMLRDGVKVEWDDENGKKRVDRVHFVRFNAPADNEFVAVRQLWVKGENGFRRPDVILYINGLPLVWIELKNSNQKLKSAYDDNLTNYRHDIAQLFMPNGFCVLSNAIETKVGSLSAAWEHFFPWLRPDDEREIIDRDAIEENGTSLERLASGLLEPVRLLDYLENFTLFYKGSSKIIAQNHQFIGVNRALEAFANRQKLDGKLGVFWHTQGSGKSFSMIFTARKILRKTGANWTFLILTDRNDLDGQIYRNFLHTGTIGPKDEVLPRDSAQFRQFLSQQKTYVFSLIQKFRYDKGKSYPVLTGRDDVIVMVDEAHRTQYENLAVNMRAGLPNANFLAFTGTPLLGKDRKTNQWFGDYVSEYNFQQSIADGATVPLFYQKRVPKVLIQNDELSDELADLYETESLDEAAQEKLENRFAKEAEVIVRDDRLETIAKDIVEHLPKRGYKGKALVISLNKFAAVKMHDKVARLWKEAIKELRGQIKKSGDESEKARLQKQLEWMKKLEMAVVVSEEAGEDAKFAAQGLNIAPHRARMNALDAHKHDIEHNFKDVEHPLQLVFVCAMWLTGFDAPTLSTLYLDKPMRDHTLMQTIARANRVTSWKIDGQEKRNGEIVDYYNVFRNMKAALNAYAQGGDGADLPVQEKSELFDLLDEALAHGRAFCASLGLDMDAITSNDDVFKSVGIFRDYADKLLEKDEWRQSYAVYENTISGLYNAAKPEVLGRKTALRAVAAFAYLRGVMEAIIERSDISAVAAKVSALLDESLVVDEENADQSGGGLLHVGKTWDLSQINFEQLQAEFKTATHKNIEITDLRAFLEHKLAQMMACNSTRADFALRLQNLIDSYNSGSSSADKYYDELVQFSRDLKEESQRHLREGLSEEELEVFDLLKKDAMTADETQKVRLAARQLLCRLRAGSPRVLVQDWFRDSQTKERVRSELRSVLNQHLPGSYSRDLFDQKVQSVWNLMLEQAGGARAWH